MLLIDTRLDIFHLVYAIAGRFASVNSLLVEHVGNANGRVLLVYYADKERHVCFAIELCSDEIERAVPHRLFQLSRAFSSSVSKGVTT